MRRRDNLHFTQPPKPKEKYESEFIFTLIDFGIISRFKVKKTVKVYDSVLGNLMFATLRGLNQQQSRFQDDVDSLFFLAYQFIFGTLPWDDDFRKRRGRLVEDNYQQLKIKNYFKSRRKMATDF